MQNNNYEKDGVKHYSYVVLVENAEFGGSKSTEQASQPAQVQKNAENSIDTDLSEFDELLGDCSEPF